MVREPNLLPDPGHGRPDQRHRHRGEPARGADRPDQGDDPAQGARPDRAARHRSAARATPARWGRPRCSARSPRSSTSWSATRWPRSGSSRSTATSRSARAGRSRPSSRSGSASDRLEPGQTLKAFVTLKPFKGERQTVEVALPLPRRPRRRGPTRRPSATWPTASAAGSATSPRCWSRATSDGVLEAIRLQTEPQRTALYLHVPLPDRGLAVQGQALAEPARQRPRRLRQRPAEPGAAGPRRPDRGRPKPPGSSKGRSRSSSPWSRTPGSLR